MRNFCRIARQAEEHDSPEPSSEDDEIFNPDNQIPGTYKDAMNSKTELGAAIRDACQELDALKTLEQGVIEEAEELLKGVGFKGSLFSSPPPSSSSSAETQADDG